MRIENLLKMNDWEIKKFLIYILSLQLAVFGLIGLDFLGIEIPLLRQILGFFYLTFVPGLVILRIFKLHELSDVKTVLYTVGLSISTLIFTGLFINYLYPVLNISQPLSTEPIIVSISVIIIILCVLCYIRDKDFIYKNHARFLNLFSTPVLFLFLIPLIAILGSFLLIFFKQNIILMLVIIIISLIVVLIGFDIKIPKKYYPIAIFIIAISILYSNNLTSFYLTGSDIHRHYFLSMIVSQNSQWNPLLYSDNSNIMASITIVPVIYSKVLNLELTWVFKAIYPIFFAFVPLGLYQLYKRFTNDKISFLATFFFISLFTFWHLKSMTQYLGEFFLVLLLLFSTDYIKNFGVIKSGILFIIFAFSLIISHYGTTLLFLFFYIIIGFILFLIFSIWRSEIFEKKFKNFRNNLYKTHSIFNIGFILIFSILTYIWYAFVGGGQIFQHILKIGYAVYSDFDNMFLPLSQSSGLQMAVGATNFSILRTINWLLFVFSIIMIAIGFLWIILKSSNKNFRFGNDWIAMTCVSILLLILSVTLANFVIWYNFERLFHLTLFFFSPFMVIGCLQIINLYNKMIKKRKKGKLYKIINKKKDKTIIAVIFVTIFFLFNSGIIYELAGDNPAVTASISIERIKNSNDPQYYHFYYYYNLSEGDVIGAKWLYKNKDEYKIFADIIAGNHVLRSYGLIENEDISFIKNKMIETNSYIYLFELNFKKGTIPIPDPKVHNKKIFLPFSDFYIGFYNNNQVYSNGDVLILKNDIN